jgi:hypothetical protein
MSARNDGGHTPGPWTACAQSEQVYGKDGSTVVYELNTNEADAHLIAAAPDMLAALKGLLTVINVQTKVQHAAEFDSARAAITKAEAKP